MSYIGNSPGVASQRVTTTITATAGQTQFTTQSGYVLGYVDVYLNGAKLVNGSDFEAITGTYITLFAGATVGDVVELISFIPRGLSDGYTKAEADAKFLDVGGDTATGSLSLAAVGITGNLTLSGGTANSIAYLNGSKVVSSGSGLTFDGTNFATTGNIAGSNLSVANTNWIGWGNYNTRLAGDSTNNTLTFSLNATEQARLTTTGLGIGTSSPSGKLHVYQTQGSMYIDNAGGIPRMRIGGGNGWGFNRITSSEDIFFGEPSDTGTWRVRGSGTISLGVGSNATTMTIGGDGGNVSIGITSSNNNKLTVYGQHVGGRSHVAIRTSDSTTGAPAIIGFYNSADARVSSVGHNMGQSLSITTQESVPIIFNVADTERVRIATNGFVGIGVTSPRAPLDLGSQNNRGQVILLGEQSANARVGFGLDAANAGMRIFTLNLSDQQIELGGMSTSDGTTWTRNHRFGIAGGNTWLNEQGGSVSIGTVSSSGLFTLKNPNVSAENVLLAIQQSGVSTGTIGKLTYNQSDDTMRLYNTSSYSGSCLALGTSNTERMRITAAGQALFGATTENLSRWGRALFNYASGTSNATIALQNATARAANNLYGLLFVDNTDESNAAVYVRQTGSNNGADLLFGTNPGTGGAGLGAVTERMRITAGGNVGLGTTAPGSDSKLDVVGNITIDSAFSSQYGICFRRGFETSDNLRIYAGDTGLGRTGGLRLSGYDGIAFGTGSNTWQERVRITNAGHMIPAANDTYDLGGVGSAWRNIYTNDLHLSNEGKPGGNDIDNTTGNWTIQEGAESLYIINNKTGKKYSFVLKEVT